MLGGGKAMINAYYDIAAQSGVEIRYETEVQELEIGGSEFVSALAARNGERERIRSKAIVLAAGGFDGILATVFDFALAFSFGLDCAFWIGAC